MIRHLMECGCFDISLLLFTLATEDGAMSGKGLRQCSSEMINSVHLYEF